MRIQGTGGQARVDHLYVADGTITTGGQAQLALAQSISRSHLMIQNLSAGPMWIEVGHARATANLTAGVVTSVTVNNGGFNYTYPPAIQFLGGGGNDGPNANSSYLGVGQSGAAAPHRVARAHCNMASASPLAGQLVSTITVDDGGAKYLCAPYVLIHSRFDLDPYGAATPAPGVGFFLGASTPPLVWDATVCPTTAIAIYGATTGQAYLIRYME